MINRLSWNNSAQQLEPLQKGKIDFHLKQRNKMALKSELRRNDWVGNVKNSEQFKDTFINGALILKNPSQQEFRDKSDKANICNRRYETSEVRAERVEKDHHEAILERMTYKNDDPLRKYFLRQRDSLTEIQPPLRYQPKDKLERIRQSIDQNQRVNLDKLDTKMLYFPVFNEDNRNKWLTKAGITMEGYKQKNTALWNEVINNNESGINPYIGGLQQIADKQTLRSRKLHKEYCHLPFNATIAQDAWKNKLANSNSLRSMKTIQASLDCLKTKNTVTFKLPELKINLKDQNQSFENENNVSMDNSNRQPIQSMKNSTQNFFLANKNDSSAELTNHHAIIKKSPKEVSPEIEIQNEKLKETKKLKVINKEKHNKIINLSSLQKTQNVFLQTQELKQVFKEWQDNPHMKIINSDNTAYNNSLNAQYSTTIENLNDQHLSRKIYDQKLYFQSAQNQVFKDKAHVYEEEKTFSTNKGENLTFNISDKMFQSPVKTNETAQSQSLMKSYSKATIEKEKLDQEKQQLHGYLSRSLVRHNSMTEIPKETFTEYTEETTQNTSKFNPYYKTSSYKKLPGINKIADESSKPYSNMSPPRNNKQSPNNRYQEKNINIQSSVEENDFVFRKKQVNKMLDHFFK